MRGCEAFVRVPSPALTLSESGRVLGFFNGPHVVEASNNSVRTEHLGAAFNIRAHGASASKRTG